MNILPFVIVSLIILACTATSFFKERQATYWEERVYTGYMNAERKLRNQIVSAHYSKIRPKEAKKNEKKEKVPLQKKEGTYVNRRERRELCELSKLNIAPLFRGHSKELYTIAAHLLQELYKEASFFKNASVPNPHYALLDSFIETAHTNKKAVQIKDFFPESLELRPLFYKMAKGTQLGYPALQEYIAMDHNTERKPISFSFASIPLLEVLFGKEATKKILELEHEKWLEDGNYHRLAEEELTQILHKSSNKPFDYNKIQHLFDFSLTAPPKRHLIGQDKTTQIIVTKEI